MPMKKGTWHQDIHHAKRAGKLGAKKSPWSSPPTPEREAQLKAERMARLRQMGVRQ